jgi:spoIIIJ-associated protein
MRVVEEFGRTVEEARAKAFKALGIASSDDAAVEVEVLDEGSPGNDLGWGRKFARIKVTLRGGETEETAAPKASEPEEEEPEEEEPVKEIEPAPRGKSEEKTPSRPRGDDRSGGAKKAAPPPVVRTPAPPDDDEEEEEVDEDDLDPDELARDVLEEILDLMRLHVNVEEDESADGNTVLNVVGPDQGILIGKHGQTLDALQFIVNLIVNKEATERRRITLDAGGYRLRREKTLKDLAWRMGRRALEERVQIALEPMGAAERRIIHMALADDPDVETFSEGEEPQRKVIISPRR